MVMEKLARKITKSFSSGETFRELFFVGPTPCLRKFTQGGLTLLCKCNSSYRLRLRACSPSYREEELQAGRLSASGLPMGARHCYFRSGGDDGGRGGDKVTK